MNSSNTTAYERVLDALRAHGYKVTNKGTTADAQCPVHDDTHPSLSVSVGDEHPVVLHCQAAAGCEPEAIVAALGLEWADVCKPRTQRVSDDDWTPAGGPAVARYDYRDENGKLLFQVCRTADKGFAQRRPDPTSKSGWRWKLDDTRRVLYRLPAVLAHVSKGEGRLVYICEGEKDVHTLEAAGLVATCNPGGAGKWRPEYNEVFRDAVVMIVADKDEPGRAHARQVRDALLPVAAAVYIVEAAEGCKDATDHVTAGHSLADLIETWSSEEPAPPPSLDGRPLYLDVAALLRGGLPDPPEPTILRRDDGRAIFYSGQVNYIFGDPDSGKTLVAQAAAAEALMDGRKVLFVDIDHNGGEAIIARFLDMGVPAEVLSDPALFRYVDPEDKDHLMAVVADAKVWQPDLAVVDSVGELLPLLNLNSNSPDDFTLAHTAVLKPLARAGAAVLAIDHLPKNTDSRASGPTGTMAKRRTIGGVSIRVTINEPFAPGRSGSAFLNLNKDRHGGLRRHCPPGGKEPNAGVFRLDSSGSDGRIRWTVHAATDAATVAAAAGVSTADLAALDALDPPPVSVSDVKARLKWGSTKAADTLRYWRSRNAPSVPGERGTHG